MQKNGDVGSECRFKWFSNAWNWPLINNLTGYCSGVAYPSNLRLCDVVCLELESVGVKRFLSLSRKRRDGSAPNIFQGLRENNFLYKLHWKTLQPAFKVSQNEERWQGRQQKIFQGGGGGIGKSKTEK